MARGDENWDNEEPMHLRTKIALRILMLMFKILSPYKFEHRFEKEMKAIDDDIKGIK